MSYRPKRVTICQEGRFGLESYEDFVEMMKTGLEAAMQPSEVGKPRIPMAKVEVVQTAEEAAQKADRGEADIVIFVSAAMVPAARRIRVKNPRMPVVVLAGTGVEGEPFIVPKRALLTDEHLVALVKAV